MVRRTGLLAYPTVEAPRYPKGFAFSLGCAVSLIICSHILNVYMKRKEYVTLMMISVNHLAILTRSRKRKSAEIEDDSLDNSDREEISTGTKQAGVHIQPFGDRTVVSSP